MSDHGPSFFFLRGPPGAANGQDSWAFFKDAQGFGRLDTGSRAGFSVALRNLDLLIKTGWSVIFRFFAENAGHG